MNNTIPHTVANSTLPLLITLVLARKQARWQYGNSAHEYNNVWELVIAHLDDSIRNTEKEIAEGLDLLAFRTKREIVE